MSLPDLLSDTLDDVPLQLGSGDRHQDKYSG